MPIDPYTPLPLTPDGRAADRLAALERRLAALERKRDGRFLGEFTNNGTSLTFDNIPQTFRHLQVRWVAQSNRAAFQNTGGRMRINNLTANWYSYGYHYNLTPGGATTRFSTSFYIGQMPAAGRTSDDLVVVALIDLPFYTRTLSKLIQCVSSGDDGTNSLWCRSQGANVETGAPISSVQLFDDVSGTLGPRSRAELWATP